MQIELTIVMPCLNEAETLLTCVNKAKGFLEKYNVEGEIIVADNGSTDGSQEIAQKNGARVVDVPVRGYGAALAAGIESAKGTYVIMGDSDDSYDFSGLMPFVEKLREGYDLVMGNRFKGGISKGAMPLMHRYFGNPVLSFIGKTFFNVSDVNDLYCGLRGFRKDAIQKLNLQSRGMEFALEMIVKSNLNRYRITEVPTTLVPDGRDRAPHLNTYRDGWRSLRFYLVMSPRWLFARPGAILTVVGTILTAALLFGPIEIGDVTFDYHTLAFTATAMVLGYQSVILGAIGKLVAIETGLHPYKTRLGILQYRGAMEVLFVIGGAVLLVGIIFGALATGLWSMSHFGDISQPSTIRLVISSTLLMTLGGQTMLAGGFLGIINMLFEKRGR